MTYQSDTEVVARHNDKVAAVPSDPAMYDSPSRLFTKRQMSWHRSTFTMEMTWPWQQSIATSVRLWDKRPSLMTEKMTVSSSSSNT
ncbi:MAG: hypothetical protein OXH63_16040 [Gemmatimonadetes bacterium]|nr:hypothetical protein [Gemmatimonadota bacterium]